MIQCLTGDVIKRAAIQTHGAAGSSGVDAYAWRRMCTSFGDASASLCDSLSSVVRCPYTVTIDSAILMPFIACRLILLDKRPGVRPIGIGNIPRRIIAKAILFSIGDDVISATVPLQTCAGHAAGSEAAIHAMRDMFYTANCEAALLIDASNTLIPSTVRLHSIILQYSALLCQQYCIIPTVLQFVYLLLVRERFHLSRPPPRDILLLWRCMHWQ